MKGKPAQRVYGYCHKFATGLLLVLTQFSQTALATDVGSIAGEFSVSNGTASYAIPIQMPQGVAGMQPEVSLNYSSQSGNGLLGVGGLSTIHRCHATLLPSIRTVFGATSNSMRMINTATGVKIYLWNEKKTEGMLTDLNQRVKGGTG